jgi:hypothetical protein
MSATAVYVDLQRIRLDAQAMETHGEQNINATTAAFNVAGGLYTLAVAGSTFGTVKLARLLPDGSSWFNAIKDTSGVAISFAANGFVSVYLSRGQYRIELG